MGPYLGEKIIGSPSPSGRFSSLADELGDVFEQDEEVQRGGRSLADEFGLGLGLDEEFAGNGSVDEVVDALGIDNSPNPPDLLTPHLHSSSLPSPTSQTWRKDPTPFDTEDKYGISDPSPHSHSPSTPPRIRHHQSHQKLTVSPQYKSSPSRYTPSIQRDPIVELQECIASTSRLIVGLKGLDRSPDYTSLGGSISSRSISSISSQGTIRAVEGDYVDRLSMYVAGMARREKRVDEYMRELEGLSKRWEGVGFGLGMDLDLREIGDEDIYLHVPDIPSKVDQDLDGLPTPIPPHLTDPLLSPIPGSYDSFSPPPAILTTPSSSLSLISTHLEGIYTDPLLPTLLILRETLHTHSSHTLATQRQVRQVKGAIQGARERDEAEEMARKGIESWEVKRVGDGLKGLGVGERLGREIEGFMGPLGAFEVDLERRMGVIRGLSR